MTEPVAPTGELTIQTIAMPADTNANGDIFGGWVVSQMDLAGAIIAKREASGRVATVAIDSMVFLHPIQVGNLVSCYAELKRIGRTSMIVFVEVWTRSYETGQHIHVTEGVFTYVAIDNHGKPRPVKSAE